ncbi:MAG: extracellular solute-binding protein, partial [Roseburia sp.]|nr:extracellular solute-binding protein [Roseburia sp.]
GQCVFAIDSTAGATWMGTDAPLCDISEDKIVEFETQVMPIPQFDTDNPQMISQGPSVCIFNKSDPQEVLASWLFVQYLLSDEVQIAYARTEGYVPVTIKAQESPVYQDYLSRGGEDNSLYYDIKIQASKLLLDNVEHTFVTPVFNGSTSLRDAAGALIESTVKSVRRKETVDEDYFARLYDNTSSLYRLNQLGRMNSASTEKTDLGKLPRTSVLLLSALGCAWILIICYVIVQMVQKKRQQHA